MSQRFTYSIPPHVLPSPATASQICVAEPPTTSLSFPATADRICVAVFPAFTRVSAGTQTSPYPHNVSAGTQTPPTPHPLFSCSPVHCSLFTVHWTYTFSAKERDSETGISYFGSRYYSSDLSVWLSVDPMASKYPSLSPYVYCADNPVRLVDPDGEHFEVVVEGNTITIKATYYTQKDNKQLLQKGLDYWNNEQSGKYSYVTGTGENQKTYTIRFDLRIAEQEYETDDAARLAAELSPSKSNNYVELSVPSHNNKGATTYGNIIQLHPEKSSEQTLHHEIGHTLGMYDTPLFNNNLMYSKGDKDNVSSVNIKHMLKNCFETRTFFWCTGSAKHVGKCISKIGKKFHGKVISNQ